MSGSADTVPLFARRRFWIAVACAIAAIVAVANVHLVYVAVTSQPDCVPHLQAPAGDGTSYRAAKSAC